MLQIQHPRFVALFGALLLVGVFPFIVLSFYVLPNLEDYAESIIPNAWWHVKYLYLTYDGRYFVSFLFAVVNPLKYQSFLGYQVIPLVLFTLLMTSIFMVIRTYIGTIHKNLVFALSTVVLVAFLDLNPNIPYSFYYMISSYIYMLPCIMFLFLLVVSKKLLSSKHTVSSLSYTVASVALLIMIAGSNELLLPPLLALLMTLYGLNYNYKLNRSGELGVISLALLCALFVVFTSPGIHDHVQGNDIEAFSFNYLWIAAKKSATYTSHHILIWLSAGPVLYIATSLFTLLLAFGSRIGVPPWTQTIPKWGIVLLLFGCILITLMSALPYCWASGDDSTETYSQIFVITEMFFLIMWFSMVYFLVARFQTKVPVLDKYRVWGLTGTILLFITALLTNSDGKVYAAYDDLLSGRAQAYHSEVSGHIFRSIHSSKFVGSDGVLQLCELQNRPNTIFSGIYFKPDDEGFHLQYRSYYGIERLEIVICDQPK